MALERSPRCMLHDTISQSSDISVHKRHHSALSTVLQPGENCRCKRSHNCGECSRKHRIRSTNKQASWRPGRNADTHQLQSSNDTGNFLRVAVFGSVLGKPTKDTSQHLSAVMSVAQHIQRATIALAGAISNDPARSRGVGARRLANCDEPLAPCSCWGGTSVSHRTRLSHNNNVASTVRYLLTRDYLRRKAQSDAGTRKQIHACHCSMRRSTVSELAARGACKVGCGFGAANAQQTHQLDPISCFSH
jgi:hypothetical protein